MNCPIEELQLNDNCFLTATANYTVASIFGNNIKTLDIGESVTSIAIGALKGLTNLETLNIPFTGTSVNPARSIGPAILQRGSTLDQLWIFILAPLVGALLASLFYKYVLKK